MLILPVKGLNRRCQSVPPLHPCLNRAVLPGIPHSKVKLSICFYIQMCTLPPAKIFSSPLMEKGSILSFVASISARILSCFFSFPIW